MKYVFKLLCWIGFHDPVDIGAMLEGIDTECRNCRRKIKGVEWWRL